jgi:hypothetical protein
MTSIQEVAVSLLQAFIGEWGNVDGFAFYVTPISTDFAPDTAGIKLSVIASETYYGRGNAKVEHYWAHPERLDEMMFAGVPGVAALMRSEMDEKLAAYSV